MVSNYINPYYNPYGQQLQSYNQQPFQQNMPQQQVIKVNGENGARAYAMGANSSALLLDECGTIVWLATTDGASYKTVTPYDITPHKTTPLPDYTNLESRITKLEDMVNEYASSNTATTQRKSSKSTNADTSNG